MAPHQVQYRLRKSVVRQYAEQRIIPKLRHNRIEQLEMMLSDPVKAYAAHLAAEMKAKTYQWAGPGKRIHYSESRKCNQRKMLALKKIMKAHDMRCRPSRNAADIERYINNYADQLRSELAELKQQT